MSRASAFGYDGVPYEALTIAGMTWPKVLREHIATRSQRSGRDQFDISDAEWATEAAQDMDRLVGDGRSRDGATVRVFGWSASHLIVAGYRAEYRKYGSNVTAGARGMVGWSKRVRGQRWRAKEVLGGNGRGGIVMVGDGTAHLIDESYHQAAGAAPSAPATRLGPPWSAGVDYLARRINGSNLAELRGTSPYGSRCK